jgi:hypothetical protein
MRATIVFLVLLGTLVNGASVPAADAFHDATEPAVQSFAGPPAQEEDSGESEEHEDLPWVPIVILAILVPLAVLLVPAFLLGGKGASRGSEQ